MFRGIPFFWSNVGLEQADNILAHIQSVHLVVYLLYGLTAQGHSVQRIQQVFVSCAYGSYGIADVDDNDVVHDILQFVVELGEGHESQPTHGVPHQCNSVQSLLLNEGS